LNFFKANFLFFGKIFVVDKLNESCHTLVPTQSRLNHVDLDILCSSMTDDASKICVFGTGLYEAKKRRKATFKIDASQAGLKINK